ncbi:aspartate kinase [Candidatus Desulforudis audaxviator]|uniref:Aspartokinase n=1 Tax=Desulforudis audaxviator (strain MP104C) TaxID=477974 RepID=B1I3M6_DESAP|nr:aspartate kinase [Candidatus Desulforudis audaxviator]ACA59587.1 aspartate kinase [Candidatus Desulforudis audaxviator MP104C]AZK59574.1 Aspartokinase [Candidatus Desulforudis audaxviator]
MLVVQKFGGTSVADPGRIARVAARIKGAVQDGHRVVVVVSAMGDTTDELLALAREVTRNPSPREIDMLMATGEQVSIALLTMALQAKDCDAISLTGAQAGITTDGIHTKGRIVDIDTARLRSELDRGRVVVVAGFQGVTPDGEITTLGRGGSDTTAVALAAALGAEVCEIYTDVDGVYTADPRLVPEARKLDVISHDEMLELASLGAVVLHPRAVELAKLYGVPLVVRSSFNDGPGTLIKEVGDLEKAAVVSGVAHDVNIAKISLFDVEDRPGIASRIFRELARSNINVDMIIQGAMRDGRNDIAFTVSRDDLSRALEAVHRIQGLVGAKGITFNDTLAKVSIVGAGMVSYPGVAATMFEGLAEAGINIAMISTSEIKVSCVISREEIERAVRALHMKFNLGEAPAGGPA